MGLQPPDAACFDASLNAAPDIDLATITSFSGGSDDLEGLPDAEQLAVATAYVGCTEGLDQIIALGAVKVPPDQVQCVTKAWEGKLTDDVLASSLAYGDGLDDLPPGLTRELAADVVGCWNDAGWWIDDVALRMDSTGLTPEQATCIATALVETQGVAFVAERRLNSLSDLTLSPDARAKLDSGNRCGADLEAPARLDVTRGQCLAHFGEGAAANVVVSCTEPHNAEVLGRHELGDTAAEWPGIQQIDAAEEDLCLNEPVGPDPSGQYVYGHDRPGRESWERGLRTLTCVILKEDLSNWVGPSGLIT